MWGMPHGHEAHTVCLVEGGWVGRWGHWPSLSVPCRYSIVGLRYLAVTHAGQIFAVKEDVLAPPSAVFEEEGMINGSGSMPWQRTPQTWLRNTTPSSSASDCSWHGADGTGADRLFGGGIRRSDPPPPPQQQTRRTSQFTQTSQPTNRTRPQISPKEHTNNSMGTHPSPAMLGLVAQKRGDKTKDIRLCA